MVDRVGAPYRVLLYQPGIRFIHLSNSKGLCLQQIKIRSLLVYIDDIIMIDNLGLNLYVISATCCVVVILENQGLARIRKFLVGV